MVCINGGTQSFSVCGACGSLTSLSLTPSLPLCARTCLCGRDVEVKRRHLPSKDRQAMHKLEDGEMLAVRRLLGSPRRIPVVLDEIKQRAAAKQKKKKVKKVKKPSEEKEEANKQVKAKNQPKPSLSKEPSQAKPRKQSGERLWGGGWCSSHTWHTGQHRLTCGWCAGLCQ